MSRFGKGPGKTGQPIGLAFNEFHVRGILKHGARVTRRPFRGPSVPKAREPQLLIRDLGVRNGHYNTFEFALGGEAKRHLVTCPYGAPGSVLMVKEPVWIAPPDWGDRDLCNRVDDDGRPRTVGYDASMNEESRRCAQDYKITCTLGRYMPGWAARLFLRVERVWVERLQDLTDADAELEGYRWDDGVGPRAQLLTRFREKAPWVRDPDPWMWCLEFTVDCFLEP